MSNYIEVSLLAQLVNLKISQAAAQFGAATLGDNIQLQAALKTQLDQQVKDSYEAAASEIVALLNNKDEFLLANAAAIAALQQQVDNLTALQGKIQLATQYGLATSNFLPLVKITASGQIPYGTDKASTEVPADWTPPAAPAPAAA